MAERPRRPRADHRVGVPRVYNEATMLEVIRQRDEAERKCDEARQKAIDECIAALSPYESDDLPYLDAAGEQPSDTIRRLVSP